MGNCKICSAFILDELIYCDECHSLRKEKLHLEVFKLELEVKKLSKELGLDED